MGADRCGWVRWGTGRMRDTETRQEGGIYGLKCQDLVPMAGEISPDIMFWEIGPKSDVCVCTWVQIDLDGCNRTNNHGEAQKQCKKRLNWMRRAYFSMHAHSAKIQDVGRDDHGDQRQPRGAIEGAQGVPSSREMYLSNEKARK